MPYTIFFFFAQGIEVIHEDQIKTFTYDIHDNTLNKIKNKNKIKFIYEYHFLIKFEPPHPAVQSKIYRFFFLRFSHAT